MEQRPIVAFQAMCNLHVDPNQVPHDFMPSWVNYNNDTRASGHIEGNFIILNGFCTDSDEQMSSFVADFLDSWNANKDNPAVTIHYISKEQLQTASNREYQSINPQPHPVGSYEAELYDIFRKAGVLFDKYNKGRKGSVTQKGDIFKLPFGNESEQLYYSEDQAVPLQDILGKIKQAEARLIDVCDPNYELESIEHAVEQALGPQVSRWFTIAMPSR